jgi:hypothetical protein
VVLQALGDKLRTFRLAHFRKSQDAALAASAFLSVAATSAEDANKVDTPSGKSATNDSRELTSGSPGSEDGDDEDDRDDEDDGDDDEGLSVNHNQEEIGSEKDFENVDDVEMKEASEEEKKFPLLSRGPDSPGSVAGASFLYGSEDSAAVPILAQISVEDVVQAIQLLCGQSRQHTSHNQQSKNRGSSQQSHAGNSQQPLPGSSQQSNPGSSQQSTLGKGQQAHSGGSQQSNAGGSQQSHAGNSNTGSLRSLMYFFDSATGMYAPGRESQLGEPLGEEEREFIRLCFIERERILHSGVTGRRLPPPPRSSCPGPSFEARKKR